MSALTPIALLLGLTLSVVGNPEPLSQRYIQFELGSAYRYDIPIYFSNYQQSTLKGFKNNQLNYTVPQDICEVRVKQVGNLTEKARLNYSDHGYNYNRDRVIYRLQDLQQSKIVIDSIILEDKIIALFPPNEIIIYSIDNKQGDIKQLSKFKIAQTDQQLLQATFVPIKGEVLLVSSKSILKISITGTWSLLTGYMTTTSQITGAVVLQNKLYIGMGQKGLAVYQMDSSIQSLTYETATQFFYKQNNKSISFDVDQFQIYPTQTQISQNPKHIYVLDYSEGLLQVELNSISNTTIISQPRFLASSCNNLIAFWSSIYMTCPELVQISMNNDLVSLTKEISFYTQSMHMEKDRLFLFGTQNFAVFDVYGRTLAEYEQLFQSQLSLVIENHLVSFGRESIASYEIVPQHSELYCFSNNSQKVGQYSGFIQAAGICKEVHGEPAITKKSWDSYCIVDQPIRVALKNSTRWSVKLEIGLAIFWTIGLLIGLVVLKAKNILLKRKYMQLVDQQQPITKENVQKNNEHLKVEEISQTNSVQSDKIKAANNLEVRPSQEKFE